MEKIVKVARAVEYHGNRRVAAGLKLVWKDAFLDQEHIHTLYLHSQTKAGRIQVDLSISSKNEEDYGLKEAYNQRRGLPDIVEEMPLVDITPDTLKTSRGRAERAAVMLLTKLNPGISLGGQLELLKSIS